jgi:hypothetical protein
MRGLMRRTVVAAGAGVILLGPAVGAASAGGVAAAGSRPAAGSRAGSGGTWGMAEEVPGTAALNTGGNAGVQAVSCPSAGNCSAGGYYNGAGQVFVVGEVNGTWGTAEQIPGIAALNQGGEAVVNAVSCASAGNCAVAGGYTDGSGFGHGFVASQVNGTWGMAEEVLGTSPLSLGSLLFVSSVSCGSAGNCSAGGIATNVPGGLGGSLTTQALVVKEVNGTWGKAREVPGTVALNTGGFADLTSVSCASAGTCSAGGVYSDGSGHQQAFVVTQTSGTWGKAREVPGTAALNTGGNARVQTVSCASAGNCSAGGSYSDGSGHQQAFVVTQTGGTWGKAREVPRIGALNQDGGAAVTSVSCASAGNCSAGGQYNDTPPGRGQAFVVDEVNGTWGKAKQVPGSAALNQGGDEPSFSGPSCSSAGNCSAVGSYTDSSGHGQAFVGDEVNGIWGTAEEVPGTAALNQGGLAQALSVSCAPAGTCSAGGLYTDSSGQLQAFVVNRA